MEIGDTVKARYTYNPLRSGSFTYAYAVVASVSPFILVSSDGDMMWSEFKVENVTVIGTATDQELDNVERRMRRTGISFTRPTVSCPWDSWQPIRDFA